MKRNLLKRTAAVMLTGMLLLSTAHAAASYSTVDPGNPYKPPVSGLFHRQSLTGENDSYTVYISPDFQPCSGSVLLLTPDNMTAETFYNSATGQAWKKIIDKNGLALVIAQPENGSAWNITDDTGARDDEAYLKKLWDRMRSKSQELNAPFDMDERAVYLVGYEEGGAAAQEFAMEWPTLFAGAASVNAPSVPQSIMQEVGNAYSYPFAQAENLDGQQEVKLRNKDIPVPFWLVGAEAADNEAAYWVDANDAEKADANAYAQTVYENDEARVWITGSDRAAQVTPQVLYDEFLSDVQRFVGDPGGRLTWTIDYSNNGKTGYFFYEKRIDGKLRRWMVYVPSRYTGKGEVPLVVATHGYSSAEKAFAGDTRWSDIAEKNGFIVVYTQAYPSDDKRGNIPVPYWNTMEKGALMEELPDDVSYFRQMLADVKQQYKIDNSRLYATGHSNGSCMTWMLAMYEADQFAAIAPIGGHIGTHVDMIPQDAEPLPLWITLGDYDYEPTTGTATGTYDALNYWTTYNGTKRQPKDTVDGRFTTHEYDNNQNIPLFRYTVIENSPHSYMPEVSEMVWNDFFSHFSLNEDGKRSYDGVQIKRNAAFVDIEGHWAQNAIESAVANGWFSGVTDTSFAPNATTTRAMLMTILARHAGEDTTGGATWYEKGMDWAKANGVSDGAQPSTNITREQLVTMLYRYAGSPAADGELDNFSDAASVSDYAVNSMQWAVANGIVTGSDGKINPQNNATRAQVAAILMRFCEMSK